MIRSLVAAVVLSAVRVLLAGCHLLRAGRPAAARFLRATRFGFTARILRAVRLVFAARVLGAARLLLAVRLPTAARFLLAARLLHAARSLAVAHPRIATGDGGGR
ncbi:hypothetical protein GCM10010112_79180 [Actinoplanes lobatus]|uniref:Uncharacterized protein n=1 Tax=Actinoplanes lobatus TaxID=113568 RepID=A0A7W7MHV7_9ACTN|nr:hypothetical protein [Actinoplanes lobatus]MBB4750874.1 hypothetical protein [Actinoplanes lobatus]GGN92241.1 hypothetical protein GCM10010112_79180 [Actinoplanes lobatus]GIE44427.1 hypothetical protein Alo02nite_73250 [Actinoplanes lobatus]